MQKNINKNVPSLYSYPGLSLVTLCWIQNLETEDVQCLKRLFICIDLRNMRAHWAVIFFILTHPDTFSTLRPLDYFCLTENS